MTKDSIKKAQLHTLQAALELISWQDNDEGKVGWSIVYNLGYLERDKSGKKISMISSNSDNSLVAIFSILRAMGINKPINLKPDRLQIGEEDEDEIVYHVSSPLSEENGRAFSALMRAMYGLTHALSHL